MALGELSRREGRAGAYVPCFGVLGLVLAFPLPICPGGVFSFPAGRLQDRCFFPPIPTGLLTCLAKCVWKRRKRKGRRGGDRQTKRGAYTKVHPSAHYRQAKTAQAKFLITTLIYLWQLHEVTTLTRCLSSSKASTPPLPSLPP